MKLSRIAALALASACLSFTQPAVPQNDRPIRIQNLYWAKPGKGDEVYRWRLHASDVRVRLGLASGRVLRRQGESEGLPDVIWQCDYPDAEARSKDVAVTTASPEFKQVQEHMDTLIRRFDRLVLADR